MHFIGIVLLEALAYSRKNWNDSHIRGIYLSVNDGVSERKWEQNVRKHFKIWKQTKAVELHGYSSKAYGPIRRRIFCETYMEYPT